MVNIYNICVYIGDTRKIRVSDLLSSYGKTSTFLKSLLFSVTKKKGLEKEKICSLRKEFHHLYFNFDTSHRTGGQKGEGTFIYF